MKRNISKPLGAAVLGLALLSGTALAGDRLPGMAHGDHYYGHGYGYDDRDYPGPFGGYGGPGYGGPGYGGPPFGHMGPEYRRDFQRWIRHRVGEWMAFVKSELEITDRQEKAWQAFADAMRERADRDRERFRSDKDDPMERDIERLEHRITRMQDYLKRARALKDARDGLYKALTKEQRAIFDDLMRDLP